MEMYDMQNRFGSIGGADSFERSVVELGSVSMESTRRNFGGIKELDIVYTESTRVIVCFCDGRTLSAQQGSHEMFCLYR
jgi:hypothetical protein